MMNTKYELELLSTAEANALSTAIATHFDIGIDFLKILNLNKGSDFILAVASSGAFSTSDANALATVDSESLVSIAFSTADATSISSAFSTGLKNAGKIRTGRSGDITVGLAFADAVAEASATADASAIGFGIAISVADATATVFSQAVSTGIDNQEASHLRMGRGKDVVKGQALANTSAIADVTTAVQSAAKLLADASARATEIDVLATVVAIGIDNEGRLTTDEGDDVVEGVAIASGSALGLAESSAIALSNVGIADASATVFGSTETIAIGVDNSSGRWDTGKGDDKVTGIGVAESSTLAQSRAIAQAFGEDSVTRVRSKSSANALGTYGVGINNSRGLMSLGHGNDIIEGFGTTAGLYGGFLRMEKGDDLLVAGIISSYTPNTQKITFATDQSGAIQDIRVLGDFGNDRFVIGGFGKNVRLDGGQDVDVLELGGTIEEYTFKIGKTSGSRKDVRIQHNGHDMLVQNVEMFVFNDVAFSFDQLVDFTS